MDKLGDPVASLDTGLPMISWTVWIRLGSHYLFILDLKLQLTADTTVRANCGNYTVRPSNSAGSQISEGPCRAGINAGTAELTADLAKCPAF